MEDSIRKAIRLRQAHEDYRSLIRSELRAFAADFPNGGPECEWKGLVLDDDDWVLRQLFKMSGCDLAKSAHWRLLLGMLAEHVIDPDEPDDNKRKYSPSALRASFWDDKNHDRLFDEASRIAKANPGFGLKKICDVLATNRRFVKDDAAIKSSALHDQLKKVLSAKRLLLDDGRLADLPDENARLKEKLSYFRFNKSGEKKS